MLQTGQKAPPFELADARGHPLSLAAALASGPTALAFFKIECETCRLAIPYFERLFRCCGGPAGPLQVMGVAQNPPEEVESAARDWGLSFPVACENPPFEVSRAYMLEVVPSFFLVEPSGLIVARAEAWSRQEFEVFCRTSCEATGTRLEKLYDEDNPPPAWKPG
ncbi:MAG TPA: redoxin domain-containing protein [Candidatus Nitrosotenuis sp.]|jgi:peroxiredoxin|nr:redoxin domain-containing protein [Candidatus Nitrosotenuis sp.]